MFRPVRPTRNWKKTIIYSLPVLIIVLFAVVWFIRSNAKEGELFPTISSKRKEGSGAPVNFTTVEERIYHPEHIRTIQTQQKINLFGEFNTNVKKLFSQPPKLVDIRTYSLQDMDVAQEGILSRNGIVYPSHKATTRIPPKQAISEAFLLNVPQGSLTYKRFFIITRLASVEPAKLENCKVIIISPPPDVTEITACFNINNENVVIDFGSVFVQKLILFNDLDADEIPKSILYMDKTILSKASSNQHGNSITIIPGSDTQIQGVLNAHQVLTKDNRYVVRNIPQQFLGSVSYMTKNRAAVSFQHEICWFSCFLKQGSTIIFVQHPDDHNLYPLISAASGAKTYVLGAKAKVVNPGIIKCIQDIIVRDYPDEDKPDELPPEGEIVLVQ